MNGCRTANLFAILAPASRWLVAVSGGADSVALLRMLCAARPDVTPVVAHLNHQTRGPDSDADAEFVRSLAASFGVRCEVALRSDVEHAMPGPLQSNASARYRAARHAFFRSVVRSCTLEGVLLAHHADDLVETTLLRLLRGGEPSALAGIRVDATVAGLRIVRPLLGVRRSDIESHLVSIGQPFREDASNASPRYARNRVRALLRDRPGLFDAMMGVARAAKAYADSTRIPRLPVEVMLDAVADLPHPIARCAVRCWIRDRASVDVDRATVDRVIEMARDRATPAALDVGRAVRIRRSAGRLVCDRRG